MPKIFKSGLKTKTQSLKVMLSITKFGYTTNISKPSIIGS